MDSSASQQSVKFEEPRENSNQLMNSTASNLNGVNDVIPAVSSYSNPVVANKSDSIASTSKLASTLTTTAETNSNLREPLTRTISSTSSINKSPSHSKSKSSTSWSENHHPNGNGRIQNSPELTTKPLPLAPSSLAPSAEQAYATATPSRSRPTSTLIRNSSLSVGGTSNSSRPSSSHPTTTLSTSTSTEELDPTALLIRRLYERLEEQGVPGDGWDEGRERSRDGIINREEAEGAATVGRSKGKGVANGLMTEEVLENGQISKKEEFVMKRVDR